MRAETVFALLAAVHLGFQVTVTALVYPALARTPPQQWAETHTRHSRRIVPLVAVIYGSLAVSGAVVVASRPDPVAFVAVVLTALTLAVTALAAAPVHSALSTFDAALLRRLLVVDRIRLAAAFAAAAAAAFAALTS